MYISEKNRQAYTEIDNFIELLDEKDKNKIPKKLRQLFKDEKDMYYDKTINPNIPIKDQNLKKETLALIALLYIKYICKDKQKIKRLIEIYRNNDIKTQEILMKKYNPDDLFKGRKTKNT